MNLLLCFLLAGCLVLIQFLIGGTRLVFSLPAYSLTALAAVLSLIWFRRPSLRAAPACVISTLLLAGYVFVRASYSPIPYLARTDLFMIAGALLVYLLTVLYITDSRARLWIIGALFIIAIAHLYVGCRQYAQQNGYMLFGFIRGDTTRRATGMLISGNHFAGYLEAIALMALALTLWSRWKPPLKMLGGYLVIACYIGVALSGSRGGYLSTLISLTAFAVLSIWITGIYKRQARHWFILVTCVAGISLTGLAAYSMLKAPLIRDRVKLLPQSHQDVRRYNWLASLDQFREAPVFGTGAGTHLYYGRLFRRPQIQHDPMHSHGDYLELLAEYGIVGEVLAVIFLFTHLASGLKNLREITIRRLCNALSSPRSDSLALILGATAAVIALMAHSVVDFNMHIPGNALFFAFLFGILASPGIDRTLPADRWASLEGPLRGGLAALGAATLIAAALCFSGEKETEEARIALREEDYQKSIERADTAIAATPSNPYPHFYRGEAYRLSAANMPLKALQSAYFEKAAASFRKGLEYFPQDENLWVRLGQSLDGAQRFEEAEKCYLNAITWDPNLGILHAYYAAHLQRRGQPEEAKQALKKSGELGFKTRNIRLEDIQTPADRRGTSE